jgi:two-component system, cell cycle sensor histidine kinase and response regulator CckA
MASEGLKNNTGFDNASTAAGYADQKENGMKVHAQAEEQIRNMTQRMLTRIGHEVTLAADGEEAVRRYREAYSHGVPIDLVIMDLTIPGGMGGKDAVREILAIDAQAKVVVASGYSTDPVMASFKDFGFCGAIVKPFQQNELKKMLKRVLAECTPTDTECL